MSATYSTRVHERKRVPQVRAVGTCQHRTAPGLHASERVPQYELLSCFCIIQHQDCMRAQVRAVDSRQHHSARTMHAKRGSQERAVGMCKHHTAAGLHEGAGTAPGLMRSKRVSQVRAVDMRQHHTAPGPCALNEFRKYEMFVCVSIVQLQACMSAQVRRQGYMRSKRVLQVRAVDMRQHHTATGCMVINEYRKYEMSACVRIIQHEGASMSASTGCRHVSASCVVRVA